MAYAQQADNSTATLQIVLIGFAAAAVAGLLAAGLILIFLALRHRHRQALISATVLWAIVLAGGVVNDALQQSRWSREYNSRVASGYSDPRDMTDRPKHPWFLWSALGTIYAGLAIVGALASNKINRIP